MGIVFFFSFSFCFFFFFFFKFFYLSIYGCVGSFVSVRGPSLVVASGGQSSSWCAVLSLSQPLSLQSTGSRHAGSVVVAHGPSCPAACGTFPDQGSNPCPLHWQADSQPLRHQGSPSFCFFKDKMFRSKKKKKTTVKKPRQEGTAMPDSLLPRGLPLSCHTRSLTRLPCVRNPKLLET